jgi:hypothetical protein
MPYTGPGNQQPSRLGIGGRFNDYHCRNKSGRYYLRWHSAQCRLLINAIQPYILPCVAYKTDLNRTCSVKEWLSESQHQTLIVDNKMARAPYTQLALSKGDDIV